MLVSTLTSMSSEGTGITEAGDRGLPAWVEHGIWWHVYPLGATGAPIRPAGPADGAPAPRLESLVAWLDYLVDLGASGLALGPIFEASTHGYDTTDHFRIDPRLGDDAVFDRLAEACRDRGVALMLDGVLNHVGTAHPLFRAAVTGGGERRLFYFDDADGSSGPPAPGPGYAVFEGHEGLAVLNHDSDEVADLAVSVLSHWLGRGASAWRLDAAYAVPPSFWARVLPRVRSEFPDAWFVGEVIHGDYRGIVERSSMDSLTQYELWKAIWSCLLDENFFELDWCLNRHNAFLDAFVPLTFVGNHDVTRPPGPRASRPSATGSTGGTRLLSGCGVVTRGSRAPAPSAWPWRTGSWSTTPSGVRGGASGCVSASTRYRGWRWRRRESRCS